jgi:putative cofactor-binding repeat protein
MKHPFVLILLLSASVTGMAATIKVPADQPTVQAGINAAHNGDVVLVAPGTYFENINFLGKAIAVKSSAGSKVTIIDGGHASSVVTFNTGEGLKSLLHGFTIQNGNSSFDGGGILVNFASPTITGNVINNNAACEGGGISLVTSAAVVQSNTISNNNLSNCVGGDGGGISGSGAAATGGPQIIGNTIENNTSSGDGARLSLNGAGSITLKNNIIRNNVVTFGSGGAMWIVNQTNVVLVQNLIYGNIASQGSGIYFLLPFSGHNLVLVNNTIVGTGSSAADSAIYATGFYDLVQFFNNLLIGGSGTSALYCDNSFDQTPPTLMNNDGYSANGTGIAGACSSQNGQQGNLSVGPIFDSKTNFHVKAGSPIIGAGNLSAPDLPTKDLSAGPRIVNGKIDMGVYEYPH